MSTVATSRTLLSDPVPRKELKLHRRWTVGFSIESGKTGNWKDQSFPIAEIQETWYSRDPLTQTQRSCNQSFAATRQDRKGSMIYDENPV